MKVLLTTSANASARVPICITVLLLLLPLQAFSFGIVETLPALHNLQDIFTTASSTIASTAAADATTTLSTTLSSSINMASEASTAASTASSPSNLLELYKQSLATHALPTKMITGGTLAVCGDAIAQAQSDENYDKKRAVSFASFDCIYRAVQHFSFPSIVQHCQGQYIGSLITAAGLDTILGASAADSTYYYGAMEQTLVSQLGIVPFFYYPVFYTITAFVQGLNTEEALQRAKDTFIPLMKRNLLFWIPVQFVQFGYIDESLQIPFLSVAGLAWTFIISLFAGNANAKQQQEDYQEVQERNEMPTPTTLELEMVEQLMIDTFVTEHEADAETEEASSTKTTNVNRILPR